MPLNDADKKWIFDTILAMLRSEGISGAAGNPANVVSTTIIDEVRKVPGWVADELNK